MIFKARLRKAEMTKEHPLAVSWLFLSSEYHFYTFCHRIRSQFVLLKNNLKKKKKTLEITLSFSYACYL